MILVKIVIIRAHKIRRFVFVTAMEEVTKITQMCVVYEVCPKSNASDLK